MKYRLWTQAIRDANGTDTGVGLFIEGEGLSTHMSWPIEADGKDSMIVALRTVANFLESTIGGIAEHENGHIAPESVDTATHG